MVIIETCLKRAGCWAVLFAAFALASCTPVVEKQTAPIFLVTDTEGRLVPATRSGEPWPRCTPEECRPLKEPDIDVKDKFSLVLVETKVPAKRGKNESTASLGSLVASSAHAMESDGHCTIVWGIYPPGIFVPYYDPNDPDCPPN